VDVEKRSGDMTRDKRDGRMKSGGQSSDIGQFSRILGRKVLGHSQGHLSFMGLVPFRSGLFFFLFLSFRHLVRSHSNHCARRTRQNSGKMS
jgi:hypothetical protein